jgi:hypothetical protein
VTPDPCGAQVNAKRQGKARIPGEGRSAPEWISRVTPVVYTIRLGGVLYISLHFASYIIHGRLGTRCAVTTASV